MNPTEVKAEEVGVAAAPGTTAVPADAKGAKG